MKTNIVGLALPSAHLPFMFVKCSLSATLAREKPEKIANMKFEEVIVTIYSPLKELHC
jgi:hypothetical protein